MTDLAPEVSSATVEVPPTPVEVPPQSVEEWKAKYEAEVQGRVKERNIYRPATRLLADLDDSERDALLGLAEMVRNGDVEGITNWSIQTAENVTGKSAAELIAARQAAAGQAPTNIASTTPETTAPPAPASADEIARAVQEALDQREQAREAQARQQAMVETMSQQMRAAGFEPSSAAGQTIIRYCRETGDMEQAIEMFRKDVLATVMASATATAAAAGQVPPPAPNGSAPSMAPAENLTPRQLMLNRLSGMRTGGA